jgi:hypothetical protein
VAFFCEEVIGGSLWVAGKGEGGVIDMKLGEWCTRWGMA